MVMYFMISLFFKMILDCTADQLSAFAEQISAPFTCHIEWDRQTIPLANALFSATAVMQSSTGRRLLFYNHISFN